MRVIVGIGNPGKKYEFNRHNIGFLFLDNFAQRKNLSFSPSKYDYQYTEGEFDNNKFLLVKPTTYVNNSGIAVLQVCQKYLTNPQDILVVVDDINLNKYDFRLKKSGSHGGHKGLASIIYHLNTTDFPRLRIGIGNQFEEGNLSQYVLSDFSKEEYEIYEKLFETFSEIVKSFIIGGYSSALKVYSLFKEKIKKQINSQLRSEEK